MIRLTVVAGRQAGRSVVVGTLPISLGREATSSLPLDDPGVWDSHASVALDRSRGFMLRCCPEAKLSVNGVAVSEHRLCNGDLLTLGAAKIRFSLSETRQRSFRGREWATWVGVGLLCAGQLALIYFLLP